MVAETTGKNCFNGELMLSVGENSGMEGD